MPVKPFDNTNLLQMCNDCGAVGFVPAVGYTYNAATGDVVVTNTSTIPAGDTFGKVHLRLTDQFGGEVRGTITVAATPVTISALTLNRSKSLNLMATIVTPGHIAADGSAYGLQAAGDVANWDVQKNA